MKKDRLINTLIPLVSLLTVVLISYSIMRFVYPKNFSEYVEKYSEEYGISENLVYAIIKCESGFRTKSVSHAGAIGLMQITADTFRWAAVKISDTESTVNSLYDAENNIRYGCCIYSILYSEFGTDETALAAYNAGRSRVLSWLADKEKSYDGIVLENIPYSETAGYVKKVINTRKIYEMLY